MNRSINYTKKHEDIPDEVLKRLLYLMLKIRKTELKIAELYHQDEMKTAIHLCTGQEAVSAGVCASLERDDYVFSNHRGHGHYIAKGGDLPALIAELYNRATGCSRGHGGSMHLIDTSVGLMGSSSIVAGGIPIATGAALGSYLKKDKRVSVVFLGDAAVEEGVLYESINFARLKKLPVVYVCENNYYAVFTPLVQRQADGDIYRRFEGLSVPGICIDGNNVLDVYRTAAKAIAKARGGEGPAFIECRTYRLKDHHGTGSGVEVGYRLQDEVDDWIKKCPVDNFERYLLEQKVLTQSGLDDLKKQIDGEIGAAFSFAQSSPFPDQQKVLDYLFYQGDN